MAVFLTGFLYKPRRASVDATVGSAARRGLGQLSGAGTDPIGRKHPTPWIV